MKIHMNEIKITDENRDAFMAEAEVLGKAYVLVVKEQIKRQADNNTSMLDIPRMI